MKILYQNIPFKKDYIDEYPENEEKSFVCNIDDSLFDNIKKSKIMHKTTEELVSLLQDPNAAIFFGDNGANFVYDELQEEYVLQILFTEENKAVLKKETVNSLVRTQLLTEYTRDNREVLTNKQTGNSFVYWIKILSI